jgi:hypothetical protein
VQGSHWGLNDHRLALVFPASDHSIFGRWNTNMHFSRCPRYGFAIRFGGEDVPLGSTKATINTTGLFCFHVLELRVITASGLGTEAYEWETGITSQASSSIVGLMIATSVSKYCGAGAVGELEESHGIRMVWSQRQCSKHTGASSCRRHGACSALWTEVTRESVYLS